MAATASLFALAALSLLFTGGTTAEGAADTGLSSASLSSDPASSAITDSAGRVQVVVELEGAASGGELDDSATYSALSDRQDNTLEALTKVAGDVVAVGRFSSLPYLTVRVDPDRLEAVEALPDVRSVTPDVAYEPDHTYEPTLDRSAPVIGADQTTAAGFDGRDWAVAIIDSGVDTSHPSLEGRVVAEACFSYTGHCPNGQTEQTGPGSAQPCELDEHHCGHGTHVASIAAGATAETDAGLNPQGVAPQADILAVQVSSTVNDTVTFAGSDVAKALEWVHEQAGSRNVAAANVSLGTELVYDIPCDNRAGATTEAISLLRDLDVPTVVAAGNGNPGAQDRVAMPACISNAISVSASTAGDTLASFTNVADAVSLVAPGEGIRAAWPQSSVVEMTGTSMAAPHVAGGWATLRQVRPADSVGEHLRVLRETAVDVPFGASGALPRIDLGAAHMALGTLNQEPRPPGRPIDVAATAADGSATVSWEAPIWDGGEDIGGYEIRSDDDEIATLVAGPQDREIEVGGLTNGRRYRFTVVAHNEIGTGRSSSRSNVVIPKSPPPPHAFDDVRRDSYFDAAVSWALAEGVTQGTSKARYSPHRDVTRRQMAAFLWRMMDAPEPTESSPFDDVDDDAYYADAVAWLAEEGVTQGRSATSFAPGDPVTRGEMAAFLWRISGALPTEPDHALFDVPPDRFYTEAVAWAARHEITTGTVEGAFEPNQAVKRGQMAAFLHRLASTPSAWDPRLEPPATIAF